MEFAPVTYDSKRFKLAVYINNGKVNDFYEYDAAANNWIDLATTGGPAQCDYPIACSSVSIGYYPAGDRMEAYAGTVPPAWERSSGNGLLDRLSIEGSRHELPSDPRIPANVARKRDDCPRRIGSRNVRSGRDRSCDQNRQHHDVTGGASAYGAVGRAEAAYFQMTNDSGGINGRKINFITAPKPPNPATWRDGLSNRMASC